VKRTLPLLCTCIFGMNFAYAQADLSQNTVTKSQEYNEAYLLFTQKNYQKALPLFDTLVNKYPQNEKINFYYARTAFELKNYEFAFTAYDRILISNPTNHRVRLELARTLFMMKSYKQAKKEFEAVLISPIPPAVRANVKKFIAAIEDKEKTYVLNKVAIFGFGWDDNVDNNIDDVSSNSPTPKHDTNFKAILVGNLIVPNKKDNTLTWETTAIGYMQEQSRYKDSNIQLASFTTGIARSNKKIKNLMSLTYDHIWYGGSQLLYIYGVSDKLQYKINKQNTLQFDMKFKKKKFSDVDDQIKNSHTAELALQYTKSFANKKDKIILSTSHITEKRDMEQDNLNANISKDTTKYKISFNKNFLKDYDFTIGYQTEIYHYKEKLSFAPELRKDHKKTFTSKLSYTLDKKQMIALEYINVNNKTNDENYLYKKQSVNLNYTILF